MIADSDYSGEISNIKVKTTDNIVVHSYTDEKHVIKIEFGKTDNEQGSIKLPCLYYGYTGISDIEETVNLVSGENGCLTYVDNEVAGMRPVSVYYDNNRKIYRYPKMFSTFSAMVILAVSVYKRKLMWVKDTH